MSYHYPDSWNSNDTNGPTGILDHLIPSGEAKGFSDNTPYKIILDDIRKLILNVESPLDGNNALGPKLNEIEIDTVKGLNRGLGEQQIMISTFSAMCDSILTQQSMTDTVAMDSFKVFKDTVIDKTLKTTDTILLETIFPKEMQKLFHLIYMLESILSSRDSELYFELLTLKNLGGKSALGTGTGNNRKSPRDYMKDPPYTNKFIEKHPYYYLKGKGRYENIMKAQQVAPFHLNNTDYFELTAAQGATGLERVGEPPMSFNSSQEYVTVYPRGSASAYRTTSTVVESKTFYSMEDFGAKDCVIYMNTPEGYPPGFYSDVVVWKDEATKTLYRDNVIDLITMELADTEEWVHPEKVAELKKYFDEKFVEITLDYATSTTYTTDAGQSFPFPFFDGSLFYDAWPQYHNTWKFGGQYLLETTHSFNEKSKIYEYFGISYLYDEAKAEDNTFFRQGATKRFINNFHKCDKAKAIRAMQELIADHILLREDAFSKIIPGFGFDEIEAIIINWIDKSIFKKTSSNYILRDLYETKVLKTNNITIKLDSNSADVKELSGQTEIIDSKEVNISLDSGVGNNISEVFKSIGVGVNPTKEVFEIDVSSLATSVDDTVIDVIQNDPLDEITARFNSDTTVELDTKDVSNMIMKFIKGDDTLSFQFVIHEELIFQEGIKSGINSYKKKWKDAHKGIDLLGKWQDDE